MEGNQEQRAPKRVTALSLPPIESRRCGKCGGPGPFKRVPSAPSGFGGTCCACVARAAKERVASARESVNAARRANYRARHPDAAPCSPGRIGEGAPKHRAALSLADRLWPRVNRSGPIVRAELGPCWVWTGYVDPSTGYGRLNARGQGGLRKTHRLAWELTKGEIPDALCVLHKCDNRACCNPDHLFLGDNDANVADMVAKGRHAGPRCASPGELHPMAKLTERDVREIRASVLPRRELAELYGVHKKQIGQIQRRKSWKHVA